MNWLGTTMNPGTYGDTWKGFLNPAALPSLPSLPTIPGFSAPAAWAAPAAAPAATPAGAAPAFNFFDPNAWTQMLQTPAAGLPFALPTLPTAAAPAAPVAPAK